MFHIELSWQFNWYKTGKTVSRYLKRRDIMLFKNNYVCDIKKVLILLLIHIVFGHHATKSKILEVW
jgi:hypothetical protein